MWKFACIAALLGTSAAADVVVAARTIRAHEVISAADLAVRPIESPGGFRDPSEVVGNEARVMLYAGRPVRANDIGPPASVERNQLVTLVYRSGALRISVDGRALGRGAQGDLIRVMNLSSKATVTGRISGDGTVEVEK
ncbi:flagellar basal body P-ring formation chaperone FlgA [Jhaorihella thermophila]|uniref:Flagella basal body P-ring formation protein FlgA n=1 Tax=Jhaorihella thermophila TaxID=488547 RepID=A0A1H5XTV9_9RHOB|nr:flagellar basal body P-ring formation chaperone FlgA [Jhaorihella thermophila]SEG14696.1 flagella basal body P-ring formation protein FlgA [Jhaorihella thermophila]